MTAEAATTIKELMFSPLKRWRHEHCNQCGNNCSPTEERFLVCVLCNIAQAIERNSEQAKLRSAHQ